MAVNIKLIRGSIAKSNAPYIVVPRDTEGAISTSFLKLPQWQSKPDNDHTQLGTVNLAGEMKATIKSETLDTSEESGNDVGIFLATTVSVPDKADSSKSTPAEVINEIGRHLAAEVKARNITHLACPLLGTGWGKLDGRDAFIKLVKGVESTQGNLTLEMYVQDEKLVQVLHEVDLSEYDDHGRFIPQEDRMDVRIETMSDTPISDPAEDKLDFKTFANALAGIIDSPGTKTPLTLVINAPWGAGKSSLGNLLRRNLETMPAHSMEKHRTIWFNAWKHDESDYLKTAFTAFIARELNPYRSWWNQLWDPMSLDLMAPSDRFKRRWRSLFYIVFLTVLIGIVLYLLHQIPVLKPLMNSLQPHMPDWMQANWAIGGTSILSITLFRYLFQFTSTLKSFIKDPKPETNAGNFKQAEMELHKLIDQAIPEGRRLIIFVDDLERCRKTGPVDLLETISQLLDHPKVVVVILADIHTVAASADLKYEDFAKRYNPSNSHFGTRSKDESGAYGRLYIQKIIQLQFDLPIFDPKDIEVLVKTAAPSNRIEISDTSSKKQAAKDSAILDRFYEMVTSTMDPVMVSIRELSRDAELRPASIFVLMVFRVLMAPVSFLSSIQRAVLGKHRWDINVDEKRGTFYKGINFLLTLAFIAVSAVAYHHLAVNGIQRLTMDQYKPEYIRGYVDAHPDSTLAELDWESRNMNEYMKYYLLVRDSEEWGDPTKRYQVSGWLEASFSILWGNYLQLEEPTLTDSPFLEELKEIENEDIELRQIRDASQDSVLTTNGVDTAYNQLFKRMESKTHVYVNAYVYKNSKLDNEELLFVLCAILLFIIVAYQTNIMQVVYSRHQRLLDSYTREVNKKTEDGRLSAEVYNPALSKTERDQIARTVVYSQIENRSQKYQEALSETMKILDLVLPRNAKRVSNKLRLMFNIAFERDILGDLEAVHFAKWVALQEAYPELVTYISRNTQDMEELEEACETHHDQKDAQQKSVAQSDQPNDESTVPDTAFEAFMKRIDVKLAEDSRIINFILYGDGSPHNNKNLRLSTKIRQLVYFTQ